MAKQLKKRYAPRELMELAVEEGEHSIPEHDEKEDPFVGAIVATKDGAILGKAHRGELRVGEHCEFTLLERSFENATCVTVFCISRWNRALTGQEARESGDAQRTLRVLV